MYKSQQNMAQAWVPVQYMWCVNQTHLWNPSVLYVLKDTNDFNKSETLWLKQTD